MKLRNSILMAAVAVMAACASTKGDPAMQESREVAQVRGQRKTTWCEVFRAHHERDQDAPPLPSMRKTSTVQKAANSPRAPQLKPHEGHMTQLAILFVKTYDAEALTPQKSDQIFFDLESPNSGLDGTVDYYLASHGNQRAELATAIYYPGDNEYGMVYNIHRDADGVRHVFPIGVIHDSDLTCLDNISSPHDNLEGMAVAAAAHPRGVKHTGKGRKRRR